MLHVWPVPTAHIIPLLDHDALEPECVTIMLYPQGRESTIHIYKEVGSSFIIRFLCCLCVRKSRHKIVLKTRSQTLTMKHSAKHTENKRSHTARSTRLL